MLRRRNRVVARDHLADKPGLGFESLPHIGVERPLRDIAINGDLFVFITLAKDTAIALFYLGGFTQGRFGIDIRNEE